MEEDRLLRDHRDRISQRVLGNLSDVLIVYHNVASLDVKESKQKLDDGRLSRSRCAYYPDFLARFDSETQSLEDGLLRYIFEVYIFECYFPLRYLEYLFGMILDFVWQF